MTLSFNASVPASALAADAVIGFFMCIGSTKPPTPLRRVIRRLKTYRR